MKLIPFSRIYFCYGCAQQQLVVRTPWARWIEDRRLRREEDEWMRTIVAVPHQSTAPNSARMAVHDETKVVPVFGESANEETPAQQPRLVVVR